MTAASIIADVKAALREAGADTGNGPLVASLQPLVIGGNPWDAPVTPPAAVEVVVILDMFKRHEIDGARILSGDVKLLMEAGEVIPKPGDGITVSSASYRIEAVMPLSPGGVALMYECQIRKT